MRKILWVKWQHLNSLWISKNWTWQSSPCFDINTAQLGDWRRYSASSPSVATATVVMCECNGKVLREMRSLHGGSLEENELNWLEFPKCRSFMQDSHRRNFRGRGVQIPLFGEGDRPSTFCDNFVEKFAFTDTIRPTTSFLRLFYSPKTW